MLNSLVPGYQEVHKMCTFFIKSFLLDDTKASIAKIPFTNQMTILFVYQSSYCEYSYDNAISNNNHSSALIVVSFYRHFIHLHFSHSLYDKLAGFAIPLSMVYIM